MRQHYSREQLARLVNSPPVQYRMLKPGRSALAHARRRRLPDIILSEPDCLGRQREIRTDNVRVCRERAITALLCCAGGLVTLAFFLTILKIVG